MKAFFMKALSLVFILGFSVATFAGTRINEVWTCTVNDGKTIDDVKSANHKWVEYVNKAVKGGDIQSYVATAIVGKQMNFIYVDSFPNMESWIAKRVAMDADEGKKIEAALMDVAMCKSNTLYSLEAS